MANRHRHHCVVLLLLARVVLMMMVWAKKGGRKCHGRRMEMTAAAVVRLFHPNYRASKLLPSSHQGDKTAGGVGGCGAEGARRLHFVREI